MSNTFADVNDGLYAEIQELYVDLEHHPGASYEPVASGDSDFGDLPPASTSEHPLPNQSEILDVLAQFNHPDVVETPEIPAARESIDVSMEVNDTREIIPEDPEQQLESQDHPVEHGTFSMPVDHSVVEQEDIHIVTEAMSEDEVVTKEPDDVVSFYGDEPAAAIDYTVEEVITEGRRTEVSRLFVAPYRHLY